MAARKKSRRKPSKRKGGKGRARKKRGGSRKKRGASKKRSKKRGGQVPMKVLEKRLGKLNALVKKRGGSAY